MPSIMPISDLRNYTEVLKEVDKKNRVYLTRNGHGAYTIMTVAEADELDRIRAGRVRSLREYEDIGISVREMYGVDTVYVSLWKRIMYFIK